MENATENQRTAELFEVLSVERLTMEAAWEQIAPTPDWKAPVSAVVTAEQLAKAVLAVAYFTATSCNVKPIPNGKFRITSIGYRAGPAGP